MNDCHFYPVTKVFGDLFSTLLGGCLLKSKEYELPHLIFWSWFHF